jgi:membrane protease YdiL (CAAX protease family)
MSSTERPELPGEPWELRDAGFVLGIVLLVQALATLFFDNVRESMTSPDSMWGELFLGHPIVLKEHVETVERILGNFLTIGYQCIWAALVLGLLPAVAQRPVTDLGLKVPNRNNSVGWALGVALLFGAATFATAGIYYWITGSNLFTDYFVSRHPQWQNKWVLVTYLVAALFVAPIVEEVVFRGGVYRGIRDAWGVPAGILLSAVIFSALHVAAGADGVTQLLGGLAFAFLYERTGSLLAPVILHFIGNAFLFLVQIFYGPTAV